MLLGVPSIEVTAAVGHDRIILWHVSQKPWNGAAAAGMYAKLGEALRKTYGDKRQFRVIEDGDTKGFQSRKGIAAKEEQLIESWKLPPRTPSWMPLDFCLWKQIEGRALSGSGSRPLGAEAYAARLRSIASHLPKTLVRGCLAKMKSNIQAVVASKGSHTMLD